MKMKKVFAMLLSCVMVLSLSACGNDNGDKGTDKDTESTVSRSEDGLWNQKFEGTTLKRILWYEPSESENKLVEEVVKNAEVEIPACMVNNQITREIEEMKRALANQGMSYEMYLAYTNMTEEQLRDSRKADTEKQIKTTLVLSELVKVENIKAEEADIEAKIEELANNMKKKPAELKKTMNANQKEVIENNIVSEKVIKLLKEKNNIK